MSVIKKRQISKLKTTVRKRAPAKAKVKKPAAALPPPPAQGPIISKFEAERGFEFPAGYGDNKIVALVRDPYWVYLYWEINLHKISEIRAQVGETLFSKSRSTLRVYDVGNWHYFDVEVGGANNWYVKVPTPNRSYCAEIGFLLPDGRFFAAARSNIVTTPLDRMSDVIDEQWLMPDWEKIYGLSGGYGQGSASGWLTSMGSPVKKLGERPFWLVANAELIVYGATEPSAAVTVQGRQVNLRPDGTFSLRYALPDGGQTIPIGALRDDGKERRQINIHVERKTE